MEGIKSNKRIFLNYFVVALAAKTILTYFIAFQAICHTPRVENSKWSLIAGDNFSYFDSFENLKTKGSFYFENQIHEKVYAGRMPVYGLLNYLLYPRLDTSTIGTVYVLFQILLEALGISLLIMLIRKRCPKQRWTQLLVFFVLLICTFQTFWTAKLNPESPGISILMILVFLVDYSRTALCKEKLWLLIGLLTIILIGLKPYMGILLPAFCFEVYSQSSKDYSKILKRVTLLCLPSLLFISCWSYRNYNVLGAFIPLTEPLSGYCFPESQLSLRRFLGAQGVSQELWDKKAVASFYYGLESNFSIEDLYVDEYITRDSLFFVRNYLSTLSLSKIDLEKEANVAALLNRMTIHYEDQHPLYPLTGFFSRIKMYLFHSGSYYLPIAKSSPCYSEGQWAFKIFESVLYYLIIFGGIIGLFLWRDYTLWFVPAFLVIFFCGIIQYVELRYFLYIYPSMILGCAATLSYLEKRLLKNKSS
jgi:hypothetical protein